MDYKEKYEQAIEALRSLFAEQAIKHCDRVNIKDITNIFPELKESESIRLWLINLLSTMQYHHCDEDMKMGNKAIAWLEKQSEQKLANSAKTCKDEQKFGDKVEPKFREGDCIQFKGFGHNRYTIKEVFGLSHYINTMGNGMDMSYTDANFEVIKDSDKVKPKQEWSEEDERMLNEVILGLKVLKYKDSGEEEKAAYQREIDWLESLRPQNKWKPDGLQLQCLSDAIRDYNKRGYEAPILKELLEQLKKLTE